MFWPVSVAFFVAVLANGGGLILGAKRSVRNVGSNGDVENRHACKCVYHYQCDDNNNVITSGIGLINIRLKLVEEPVRIQCPSSTFPGEIVCCKLKSNNTLKPLIKSPEEGIPINEKETPTCGFQRTIINVRIFAGNDDMTPIDSEFPWIAAIYKRSSSDGYKFQCSGSLIHPKVVLTANHCVHRKKSNKFVVVVNGKTKLSGPVSTPEDSRNVSDIIRHPDYNSGALFNDVALLILAEPFVVLKQRKINTLCLPTSKVSLENSKCLVAGWGKDNSGQNQQYLRKVELPFVNHSQCQSLLRQTRLGDSFELDDSFMCAGGQKEKDACKGDGGSPLMCAMPDDSDRYFQAGIVSWGVECGLENVPGVYADVQKAAEWIRTELKERHLDI